MGGDDQRSSSHRQIKHGKQTGLGKCKEDKSHRVRPERLGDDAARGALPAKQTWKMSPGSVDEGELGQLKVRGKKIAPHEPPGP